MTKTSELAVQAANKSYNANSDRVLHAYFKAGTPIFSEGEERDCAFIVEAGAVEIHRQANGKKQTLDRLEIGEIFGEMALISNGMRTASATALEDTHVYVISRQAMQSRMNGLDPMMGMLISLLVDRYRAIRIEMPETPFMDDDGKPLSVEHRIRNSEISAEMFDHHRDMIMKELKLEQEMRTALSGNQFEAYYQPIVSLNDNAVYGFETLIRWNHPERGLVSPGEFIPVAERTGMVHLLDEVMLHQACDFLKLMEERDVIHSDTRFSMSTNLSGVNFETIDIVDMIRRAINDKKINPRHLKVEITESALIGDPVMASEVLGDLKKLGVRISLDDFGTGYSSLNYLHKFPIDELKIDRSFVSQINKERKTLDIVRAICSLAQSFKMGLVAEGIERPDEITALYGVGCDIGQGYLFSKPLSRDAALEYVIGHSLVSGT